MGTAARKTYQRARSETEKTDRRQSILRAAEALIAEVGMDRWSMSALGKKAGVAKGTLYLYFETKEELLLALYVERLEDWCTKLIDGTRRNMSDSAFCTLFFSIAKTDPLFLDLSARLSSVIERNVAMESFVASKRAMLGVVVPLAQHLETCLKLKPGGGEKIVTSFTALMLGAAQLDSNDVFDKSALPKDVQQFLTAFACDDVFGTFAPLILKGVRNR